MKEYFKYYYNHSVDDNLMLVKLNCGFVRFVAVIILILRSRINNSNIYVYGENQGNIKVLILKVLRIHYLKKKSKTYYYALANAKYLYLDDDIDEFFVKKDGQIYYMCSLPDTKNELQHNINVLKADYIEKTVVKDAKQFVSAINNKQDLCSVPDKKRTLILVNKAYVPMIRKYLANMFECIDYENNEVILFIENMTSFEYSSIRSFINGNVVCISKGGRIYLGPEMKDTSDAFTKLLNDPEEAVFDGDPEALCDIYGMENRRVFGNRHFDTVINFGFNTNYWLSLIYSVSPKQLYMHYSNTDIQKNSVINSALSNDKIEEHYFTVVRVENPSEDIEELLCCSYIPNLSHKNISECIEGRLDGKDVIISDYSKDYYPGAYSLDVMPYFDAKDGCSYMIVDNALQKYEWCDFIEALDIEDLHIYDVFNILKDCYITHPVYQSLTLLYSLMDRYDSCICYDGSDPLIMKEADSFGKGIQAYDIDGNKCHVDFNMDDPVFEDIINILFKKSR